MSIISQNNIKSQETESAISRFMKNYRVGDLLYKCNAGKAKGFSVIDIFRYLVSLVFYDRSMYMQMLTNRYTEAFGKKLYVSAIFDCFNSEALGLAMADNMRAELCVTTLKNAVMKFQEPSGAIVHSDRGSQYTSAEYRAVVLKYNIVQSMNCAGGRCHDNARCESMWGRMKEELLYGRYKT